MRRFAAIAIALLLGMSVQAHAEYETLPPYIYYYSHLMGGIIVERADGTDSRHFATEALPSDHRLHGLGGPGWSASGRHFAAFGLRYGRASQPLAVIDIRGTSLFEWMRYVASPISMRWSPGDEDLLILLGGYAPPPGLGSFIWLLDVPKQTVLAEIGINLDIEWPGLGQIDWDLANERVVIGMGPGWWYGNSPTYYRVTMQFDGTVIKQPIPREEVLREARPDSEVSSADPVAEWGIIRDGISTSPSGRFQTYLDQITDSVTGQTFTLPRHSQSTMCRKYLWTPDEEFIIMLSGTIRAGGGCGGAMVGVADVQGDLWREIGVCDWVEPCVGWLPPQVDVSALPPGQPHSVLLEPVRYDPDQYLEGMYESPFRADCQEGDRVAIIEKETEQLLYTLVNTPCPFREGWTDWRKHIQVDYLESHELLATFVYNYAFAQFYVHVSQRTPDGFEMVLRLNAEGYDLEFTEDGQYLRARNVHAWKVYAVEDILDAIQVKAADSETLP